MRFEQITAVVARPVVFIVGRSIVVAVSFVTGMCLGGEKHLYGRAPRWLALAGEALCCSHLRRHCRHGHAAAPAAAPAACSA